ncbi:uncharacterized protein [Epargyreus clarus]|uniref:uncharacterized protein n=1 Tax=Epargyreus clarus TaxID=520877 RepID=UPI003C2CB39E
MGGCRCTYRNCRVKSDGKTHMFHYPVFEKIRCHQWLINAHRLDFLDLKVSQLKNRVICQHHFKDECFMNFTKGKLTFDAIPTEDGPYCDPTKYENNNVSSKVYCILVDDIEDDITGCDKKANYAMKYGDFLTNLDVMDMEKTEQANITYKPENSTLDIVLPNGENSKDKLINEDGSFVFKLSLSDKSDRKSLTQPMLAVQPYINSKLKSRNAIVKNNPQYKNSNVSLNIKQDTSTYNRENNERTQSSEQKVVKKQPKITIISEKKITNPVPITGKFEPVSPNFLLNAPKSKRNVKTNVDTPRLNENNDNKIPEHKELFVKEISPQKSPVQETKKIVEIEIEPLKIKDENTQEPMYPVNIKRTNATYKPTKVSLLKPRVPPERVEAINKKRKFNMKLRDIIETCLDKLENSDKASEDSTPVESPIIKKRVQHQHTPSLPKESPVLSTQEYTIAFLEARMRKMENTLLEKIDQNSEKINDLKNIYAKASTSKKNTTPSKVDEEAHKRELFQEISKYLSPSSKSLIYEELFINKFAVNESNISPKRRRRR